MPTFRTHAARIVIMMTAVLASALLAGCGQGQTNSSSLEQTGDTAAAVLQAYRQYGDAIANLDAANPETSVAVTNVTGTVPAYDLTQGDPPCPGFVQVAPSLVFALATDAEAVEVAFVGNTMTTLIVVAEGEAILCDESAPVSLTPKLTVQQPKAGRYGVWVGRVDMQEPIHGKLTVTVEP